MTIEHVPSVPHTITIEITVSATSVDEADDIGQEMVDYLCSSWDGAAAAVVNIVNPAALERQFEAQVKNAADFIRRYREGGTGQS